MVRDPFFHIVMHEPEIPNNTGNIGRTCIATGCALHLIRPLGFDTSEKALRRAGLDYWPRLDVQEYDDWPTFQSWWAAGAARAVSPSRSPVCWLTSGKGGRPCWEADLHAGDAIIFGKETRGLPDDILEHGREHIVHLPMISGERGLNVATAVCAIVYEGIRQCLSRGQATIDPQGRLERT
jgi:tRNA (cytidine/uridine-2'-O-)-methyltransferase